MMPLNLETSDDARLMDALVDGELAEEPRADLLRRLEQMPDGWRRLSLAFLEAQAVRQAIGIRAVSSANVEVTPASSAKRANERSRVPTWTSVCALVGLLAFGIGNFSARWQLPTAGESPSASTQAATSPGAGAKQDREPGAVAAMDAQAVTPAVRKQLERLGYRVQERPRTVSVRRADGQTVPVLVNEVEIRYVGRSSSL